MARLIKRFPIPARILALVAGISLAASGAFFTFGNPISVKADVGTITISGIGSGPNYSGLGTWAPVGNQKCYNKGSGFRYYIEVFEDVNHDGEFNAGDVIKQVINPAPCGDQFDISNPPSDDLTDGGTWPAIGQTPNPTSFTLASGTHYFCSVLRHVKFPSPGNDIVATSCLDNPVVIPGPGPQVTITKTDNHDTAAPGEVLTYQVTVTETTDDVGAEAVKVTDTVPSNLTIVTNISDGGSLSSGVITWNISLDNGETKVLTYQGTVDPNLPVGTTILVNSAELGCGIPTGPTGIVSLFVPQCTYVGTAVDTTSVTVEQPAICGDGVVNQTSEQCDGTAGVGANQTCTTNCTLQTVTPPTPVLTLAKLDTPDPVADDANLTYTVNYSVATTQATGVVITDPLPANTTFVSAANGGTYGSATNTVTWNLGTVAVGSYSTTLVLHVNASVADGTTITNTATIDSAETDPLQASQTTTVKRQDPALSLTKVVNVTFANPGDVVLYTVTVKNTGTDTAHNLTLTDTLPAGFTFVENGKGTITKTFLDSLAVGASASMSYQVQVGNKVTAGTFDNLAVVQGTAVGPVSAKAGLEVRKPKVLGDTTPQVLGAEALPETGASPLDLAQLLGSGLVTLGGLTLIIRRRRI